MKLVLFLGAGVSRDSGLPLAHELDERILNRPWHQNGPRRFAAGWTNDSRVQEMDSTPRIRRLLSLIKQHDVRDIAQVGYFLSGTKLESSGAIYRSGGSTYEDLFFLCSQIRLWNLGLSDNSLTTPFMESIERQAGTILNGRDQKYRMWDLSNLASLACVFIETVVAESLHATTPIGFDLIRDLANLPHVEQLNIVTLNHDLLVEYSLAENGISFSDGFGKPDGDVRWHDEDAFNRPTRVHLLKLHGSINWYSFMIGGQSRAAILMGTDPSTVKRGDGTAVTTIFQTPSFLSGLDKAVAYHRGIYADIHFRFHQMLRECGVMLMSGYGWGDTAINFELETWLDRRASNTIIQLHKFPEETTTRSMMVASNYDYWITERKLIPLTKWLSEVTTDDLKANAATAKCLW